MTRRHSKDQCVECGAPANHRLVCPEHEALYADRLVDDVDPASRPPLPLRVVEVGDWRPIETAPLDMTEVLVLIRPKVIRLGWYFAPSSRTKGWRDENNRPINPTHWRPLPEAPQQKADTP